MNRDQACGSLLNILLGFAVISAATLGWTFATPSAASVASQPESFQLGAPPQSLTSEFERGDGTRQAPRAAALSALHHAPIRCSDSTVNQLTISDSLRLSRLTRSLEIDGTLVSGVDWLIRLALATSTLAAAGPLRPTLSWLHVRLQI